MADFTEGPWEMALEAGGDNFAISIYGPAGDYKGLLIARVSQSGWHNADARLIAAAPDLFAALSEVLRRLDNGPDNPDAYDSIGAQLPAGGELCEEKVDDLIRFVRGALAKARGAHPERAASEEAGR